MSRSVTAVAISVATAAVLSVGLAAPAAAEIASPRAACPGLALSDHAVTEGPRTVSGLVALLRDIRASLGFRNNGQVVSRWAAVHAGTHVPGCEDALMSVLTAGPSPRR